MTKPKKKVATKPRRRAARPPKAPVRPEAPAAAVTGDCAVPPPLRAPYFPEIRLHHLKIWPENLDRLRRRGVHLCPGDRDFRVGDLVLFQEYDPRRGYGDDWSVKRISAIVRGHELPHEAGLLGTHVLLELNSSDHPYVDLSEFVAPYLARQPARA